MDIKEVRVQVPIASTSSSRVIVPHVVETNQEQQKTNDLGVNNELIIQQPQEVGLRRSHRDRKSAISNNYVVYL